MTQLRIGDRAPEFALANQDGNLISLAEFSGRRVVIYFYPRDDTRGCTAEACQFSDLLPNFAKAQVDVVGISPDDGESHKSFRAKYGLNVNLLSDIDHTVMDAYGAWEVKVRWNGQMTVKAIRSTFVVGTDGNILAAWYDVKPDGHAEQVRTSLAVG